MRGRRVLSLRGDGARGRRHRAADRGGARGACGRGDSPDRRRVGCRAARRRRLPEGAADDGVPARRAGGEGAGGPCAVDDPAAGAGGRAGGEPHALRAAARAGEPVARGEGGRARGGVRAGHHGRLRKPGPCGGVRRVGVRHDPVEPVVQPARGMRVRVSRPGSLRGVHDRLLAVPSAREAGASSGRDGGAVEAVRPGRMVGRAGGSVRGADPDRDARSARGWDCRGRLRRRA